MVQAKSDADTQIVEAALKLKQENSDCNVQILADDTDILCLLLHHCYVESCNEIMIPSLTSTSLSKNKECYRVDDIICNHDIQTVKYILFSHAFSGSDTTSGIFNFGKKKIVKKICQSEELRQEADWKIGNTHISDYF